MDSRDILKGSGWGTLSLPQRRLCRAGLAKPPPTPWPPFRHTGFRVLLLAAPCQHLRRGAFGACGAAAPARRPVSGVKCTLHSARSSLRPAQQLVLHSALRVAACKDRLCRTLSGVSRQDRIWTRIQFHSKNSLDYVKLCAPQADLYALHTDQHWHCQSAYLNAPAAWPLGRAAVACKSRNPIQREPLRLIRPELH